MAKPPAAGRTGAAPWIPQVPRVQLARDLRQTDPEGPRRDAQGAIEERRSAREEREARERGGELVVIALVEAIVIKSEEGIVILVARLISKGLRALHTIPQPARTCRKIFTEGIKFPRIHLRIPGAKNLREK